MKYLEKGATVSADGRYRYRLWREWRDIMTPREHWRWLGAKDGAGHELGEPKAVLFIMLNPSTADGDVDDPTIRKCVGFAKALCYDRLEVVNLFAHRATKPQDMKHSDDPVGHENQGYVEDAADRAGKIICAWGTHGGHINQDETMLGWLAGRTCWALGTTKDGFPLHPLMTPYSAADRLVRYDGR